MMATIVRVTRNVLQDTPGNYAGRDVSEGEVLHIFRGHDYGCTNTAVGIALSETGAFDYPCFEFPLDAVEEI